MHTILYIALFPSTDQICTLFANHLPFALLFTLFYENDDRKSISEIKDFKLNYLSAKKCNS